jgi:hypothetical protein
MAKKSSFIQDQRGGSMDTVGTPGSKPHKIPAPKAPRKKVGKKRK